jgi:hypothetical protein
MALATHTPMRPSTWPSSIPNLPLYLLFYFCLFLRLNWSSVPNCH